MIQIKIISKYILQGTKCHPPLSLLSLSLSLFFSQAFSLSFSFYKFKTIYPTFYLFNIKFILLVITFRLLLTTYTASTAFKNIFV